MCHRLPEKYIEPIKQSIGLKRWGSIEELYKTLEFLINVEYVTGQNKIVYHMDLYRIKNISEIEGIGLFEYLESGNLCIIEWGDMIEKLIDSKYDKFIISKQNEFRIIEKIK